MLGAHGADNVHGEAQQKLDVIANELLMTCLGGRPTVAVVASEEDDEPTLLRTGSEGGRYCVIFDPLDGSSNLDVSVGVGTIFSILRNDPTIPGAAETICQRGSRQVAAGYILYGSSTVFVLTTGHGVDMFVLDPSIGSFVLVESQIQIPRTGKTYSVNEANRRGFPHGINAYLDWAHDAGYSSRYIGSMVADVHRTLLKGGVFLYPPTRKEPGRQAAADVEGNPLAFLIEQAWRQGRGRHRDIGHAAAGRAADRACIRGRAWCWDHRTKSRPSCATCADLPETNGGGPAGPAPPSTPRSQPSVSIPRTTARTRRPPRLGQGPGCSP